MKSKSIYHLAVLFLFLTLLALPLSSKDEGQWMPTQINKLPWSQLQQLGLQLTPEQIYNPNGPSLEDAIVLLGGGTGSFVSADGLIITNHHVAVGAVQSVSSVETDYLKDGFTAETRDKEIAIPSYSARVVVDMQDVTNEIYSTLSDTMSPESRTKAIRAKSTEVEKKAKGESDYICNVVDFFYGVKYYLIKYETLKDIRLVLAPPVSIGTYGGDDDNWMWPRHTGDFAFMRAYVSPEGKSVAYAKENVPYKPRKFLPMSTEGVQEGTFSMIMGFPGRTFRYRTSPEMQIQVDETLPLGIDLGKTQIDIINEARKKDHAVSIKYHSRVQGISNGWKYREGALLGIKSADVIKLRQNEETKFKSFLSTQPELQKKYGNIIYEIDQLYKELRTFNKKQIVLGQGFFVADGIRLASSFKDFANSFEKDSVSGDMKPTESSIKNLKDTYTNVLKNSDVNVDKTLLVAMLKKASELPTEQKISAVQKIVGDKTGEKLDKALWNFVNDLYDDSRLTTVEGCEKLISKDADDIKDDALVQFMMELDNDFAPLQGMTQKFNSKAGVLRTRLMEAWLKYKNTEIYPDANRTLRFTYGQVMPYYARDAVRYNYVTTLSGVMQKETGADPFIVPEKLKTLHEKKAFGEYADPKMNDVPVAFVATLDITGGNSGSPVMNGKGELIGVAFDGNWEGMANDYYYQPSVNRTISVDSRYVLFYIDKYANAQNILNEIKGKVSQ